MTAYNFNMWGQNWWQKQQNKEAAVNYQPPDKCTFCSIEIKEGDYFYAGYDRYNIYSETCDNVKCYQWLEKRRRVRKYPGKDYK
jgi:hypothetical protein